MYLEFGTASYTDEEVNTARKAVAMAIKMFGWYKILNPKHANYDANVCDRSNNHSCCQEYADQYHFSGPVPSYLSTAINSIQDVGVRTSNGYILLAEYRAGDFNSIGQNSGILRQKGVLYLAKNQGLNYMQILNYYYSYCLTQEVGRSPGSIQFFTVTH